MGRVSFLTRDTYCTYCIDTDIVCLVLNSEPCLLRLLEALSENKDSLTAALQFFVEVASYQALKGAYPSESELKTKTFQGIELTGVALLHMTTTNYFVLYF